MIYVINYNDKYYLFIFIVFLMLSRISRLPLRRCLHTGAPVANSGSSFGKTARIIVGVSTFSATAYLTWRLRESRHIASDSPSSNNCSSYRKTVTSMWLIFYNSFIDFYVEVISTLKSAFLYFQFTSKRWNTSFQYRLGLRYRLWRCKKRRKCRWRRRRWRGLVK